MEECIGLPDPEPSMAADRAESMKFVRLHRYETWGARKNCLAASRRALQVPPGPAANVVHYAVDIAVAVLAAVFSGQDCSPEMDPHRNLERT